MADDQAYRVRFRFRLGKKLTIKEHERHLKIAQREVTLSPQLPDVPIDQSEWLVMNARGFETEDDARSFGHQLRGALELSSVASRIPARFQSFEKWLRPVFGDTRLLRRLFQSRRGGLP